MEDAELKVRPMWVSLLCQELQIPLPVYNCANIKR